LDYFLLNERRTIMGETTTARRPKKCPECHIIWEDWQSSTIHRWEDKTGVWVWRELQDFPAIGCNTEICPDCQENSHQIIKVASGVSD